MPKRKINLQPDNDSDTFALSDDSFLDFESVSDLENVYGDDGNQIFKYRYKEVLKLTEELMTTFDKEKIYKIIISKAIDLTRAERGYLIIVRGKVKKRYKVVYQQNMDTAGNEDPLSQISQSVLNKVVAEKKVQIIRNAIKDPELDSDSSIVKLNLKSVICAPMIINDRVLGIIYLENRTVPGIFDEDSGELLMFFGNQCAVALQNLKLIEENEKYSSDLEKQVEKRARELSYEKIYSANIIDNISEILMVVNRRYNILKVNKSFWKVLKLDKKNINKIDKSLFSYYDDINGIHLKNALKNQDPKSSIRCRMKVGEEQYILVSVTMSPLLDPKTGKSIGTIVLNRDITEIAKYEKIKLAEKEIDSITKMAVTANDQINTPLSVISGRAFMISSLMGEDNLEMKKHVDIIKEQVYRIKKTLDHMQQLTTIESKKYQLEGVDMIDLYNIGDQDE